MKRIDDLIKIREKRIAQIQKETKGQQLTKSMLLKEDWDYLTELGKLKTIKVAVSQKSEDWLIKEYYEVLYSLNIYKDMAKYAKSLVIEKVIDKKRPS